MVEPALMAKPTLTATMHPQTLQDAISIPAWRNATSRRMFEQNVRKHFKPTTESIGAFSAPYCMRKQWIPKFAQIKNDVPLPMLHMFYSMVSKEHFDLPTLAKYMDLGKLQARLFFGANVNEVDRWGRTAGHYAVINADTDMLAVLAARGANLSIVDRLGASPLSILADPWRQARSSAWASMAAQHGVTSIVDGAKMLKMMVTSADVGNAAPSGWVERTQLPWKRAYRGSSDVGDAIDSIPADIPIATLQKEYLANSKPFKVSGVFRACETLLRSFDKKTFTDSEYMSTKVSPGKLPYGEDGRPMDRSITLANFIEQHMGKEVLQGNVTYKTVPRYVFTGTEQLNHQKIWKRLMKNLTTCMEQTIPWLKDFGVTPFNMWTVGFGSGGSGAPFHAHAAAVNVAIVGHKLWHVYPPYTSNYTSDPTSIWHNRNDVEELEKPVTFEQHPGDLLFIPASWAHSTMCLGDSISFSAVMPNSLNGVDAEQESVTCELGDAEKCNEIDLKHPGQWITRTKEAIKHMNSHPRRASSFKTKEDKETAHLRR
jgi:hypothetical protein